MKKLMLIMAALAIAAPALVQAQSASWPLRDAVQITAAQTANVTNTFADGATTFDRIAVRAASPATGTLTLRHIWSADGLTATNSWTVTYTNTATVAMAITNAWPVLQGDILQADLGTVATGTVWFGRSKIVSTPAR